MGRKSKYQDSNKCVEHGCDNKTRGSFYWCAKCAKEIESAKNDAFLTKFYGEPKVNDDKESMDAFREYLNNHKLLKEWFFEVKKSWRFGNNGYIIKARHCIGWYENKNRRPCRNPFSLKYYKYHESKIEIDDNSKLWLRVLVKRQELIEDQQRMLEHERHKRKEKAREAERRARIDTVQKQWNEARKVQLKGIMGPYFDPVTGDIVTKG